jgi:hypothetical protein
VKVALDLGALCRQMKLGFLMRAIIAGVRTLRSEDYYPKGKRWWLRLHEKGGKRHEMPAVSVAIDPLATFARSAAGPARGQASVTCSRT